MFTGLIKEIGTVKNLARGTVSKLTVASSVVINEITIGDSVAVNGVCLTATSISGDLIIFDAVSETLSRSTLGDLRSGDKVNLEPSLRAGQMIGGHIVQVHVD